MITRSWPGIAVLVTVLVSSVLAQTQPSPLFAVAERGDLNEVDRLLRAGADANAAGEFRIGDRPYRVSALGAAAIGWHADVARLLLERGAGYPRYFVRNHNLVPASPQELTPLRDWEVVNSVLRMPEVATLMQAIVDREAGGTYRTHDGREFVVQSAAGGLEFRSPDGPPLLFQHVLGKAFVQRLPREQPAPAAGRTQTAQDRAMFDRFVEPMSAADKSELQEQFRDRG